MNMEMQFLSHSRLAEQCAEESSKRDSRQRDDRFCFELVRRAFGGEDGDALGYVIQIYKTVWSKFWIRDVHSFETQAFTADDFKSMAFQKVYLQIKGEKFDTFTSVNAVLSYLHITLARTIAEHFRSIKTPRPPTYVQAAADEDAPNVEEYIPSTVNVSEEAEKNLAWQEIERRIYVLLPDKNDQMLFDCWAKQQLSRIEIVEEFGEIWADENAVRVALQRIKRRLYKDQTLRTLLKGN